MSPTVKSKIEAAIIWALYNTININSPFDTGNLRYNGIKFERVSDTEWRIYVDADEYKKSVAYYMKYTNEDWNQFAPPLYGKTNPNLHWWNKEAANFAQMLTILLHGEIS